MEHYSKNIKCCGTCNYWGGARDTNNFGEYALVGSPMTKGICRCQGGRWKNMERQANESCVDYMKWNVLR